MQKYHGKHQQFEYFLLYSTHLALLLCSLFFLLASLCPCLASMYLARQVSQGAADRATSGEGGVEEEDVVEAMAASIVELELNSKEMGNEMFGHVQFTLYSSRQKITGRRFSWKKSFLFFSSVWWKWLNTGVGRMENKIVISRRDPILLHCTPLHTHVHPFRRGGRQ